MYFGRGKNRIKDPYTLTDLYEGYIKWVEQKELYTVRRADFVKIISDFNNIVAQKLLAGQDFYMPAGMGRFRIVKSKNNSPVTTVSAVDWLETNKIGKIVYFRNQHSNGYRYKLKWDVTGQGVKNGNKYYFVPCRNFKRTLAKIIKARETDYFQLS